MNKRMGEENERKGRERDKKFLISLVRFIN
jgi:hypothetical protein